jgi:alkanesulfonate monooxygenase SsuD/methylene tetrahydromethanopterin reductase-like flavin-dependent oxidoreductase (luciferase family)
VRVPLYLGVHGPASLRLSGELADGTLLGWFSSPGYVAWARGRLAEGRESAGRHDPHELVVLCLLSLSRDDPTTAIAQLGAWAAPMLAGMVDAPQLTVSSEGEELRALLTGEPDAAPSVPPSLLGQFVACGDVADCAATVDRLLEAGADRVVLVPNPAGYRSTAAMVEQLQLASAIVADR